MQDTSETVTTFDPFNPQHQRAFLERLDQHNKALLQLKNDGKKLQVDAKLLFKALSKKGNKRAPRDPNAPKKDPSGFARPQKVSLELTQFLGMQPDQEIARTEVTKQIVKYIQENKLQNPENKREILLNPALKKLLNVEGPITFFQLQIYMKHHFPSKKSGDAAPEPAAPEPVAATPEPTAAAPAKKKVMVKRKTAGAVAAK